MSYESDAGRGRSALAVAGAFLVVLLLGVLGWVMVRPEPGQPAAAFIPPPSTPTTEPTPDDEPTPTPTPSPTKKPATTRRPAPKPTKAPPPAERPPAPKPQPTPTEGTDCPSYEGTNASQDNVRDALVEAGQNQLWPGANPQPRGLVNPLPEITIPPQLMKAVAWQESGWQSAILACDGGMGTMQLMPGTVDQVNNRFGRNYDVHTLSGNTKLGAGYLQWLTVYFGQWYFGERYDLEAGISAPIGKGGAKMYLLDVVIAAYNVGPGNIENLNGTPNDGTDDTLGIPNMSYVKNVKALMTNCECLAF